MGLRHLLQTSSTDHDTIGLEAEEVYRILAERRRRLLVPILDEREADEFPLYELARGVAALETATMPDDVPADAYERAYIALYQSHIPVLDRHGVVEWDDDSGLVRCGPSVPGLAEIVQEIENRTE